MHKIISHEEIQKAVTEITKNIPIENAVLLGVLDGCIPFLSDLMKNIDDKNLDVRTVSVTSYYGTKREEIRKVEFDFALDYLHEKDVIIVDDIYDSGSTVKYLTEKLKPYCKKIHWCCLLKRENSKVDHKMIPGFMEIPQDDFVVGYGLDYTGKFRALKDIHRLEKKD